VPALRRGAADGGVEIEPHPPPFTGEAAEGGGGGQSHPSTSSIHESCWRRLDRLRVPPKRVPQHARLFVGRQPRRLPAAVASHGTAPSLETVYLAEVRMRSPRQGQPPLAAMVALPFCRIRPGLNCRNPTPSGDSWLKSGCYSHLSASASALVLASV